jgi:hypothetical protein
LGLDEELQGRRNAVAAKRLFSTVVAAGILSATALSLAPAAVASAHTAAQSSATRAAVRGIPGWVRAHREQIARAVVTISAQAIGVTPSALVADLRSGQSIAEVATANGVNPQTVENDLVSAGDAAVATALADGKITSARASAIDAALPPLVAKLVNHVF